jgi:capsular exopolysaccharide synthesis family protein
MSTNNRKIVTHENPQSAASEAYRVLRTNLRFAAAGEPLQTVAIASAERGEGKSVTAVNLAAAFAQEGKNVVVVDADLRGPSLHYFFAKSNRVGLSTILTGNAQLRQAAVPSGIENLTLLPSGPVPPNPAELLGSERMSGLLEELKAEFDIVIFDTPPTLAVTDSQVLAAKCDGVLFVVRSGSVRRSAAVRAVARLRQVHARLLGAVLNRSLAAHAMYDPY